MNARMFDLFVPELFERENLLDFSSDYTNCVPSHSERFANFYQELSEKYDTLAYIGDKIPNNHMHIEAIHNKFPNSKTVFIVRDITETACSWQARADRISDGWSASKTAECSVTPWNKCNAAILNMKEMHPNDCYVVDYHSFFDGDPEDMQQLDALSSFLQLDADQGLIDAFSKARDIYTKRIKNKERSLSADASRYIAENADYGNYEKVLALTERAATEQVSMMRRAA